MIGKSVDQFGYYSFYFNLEILLHIYKK